MNGGFLNLSVSACCHGEVIEPAVINVRYPGNVTHFAHQDLIYFSKFF